VHNFRNQLSGSVRFILLGRSFLGKEWAKVCCKDVLDNLHTIHCDVISCQFMCNTSMRKIVFFWSEFGFRGQR
jgi:hypothetical protein